MRAFIMVLALLVMSAVARADGAAASYWVVGSYDRLADARVGRLEVQKSLGEQVKIVRFDQADGTLYRLVVPATYDQTAQRSRMEAAGLSPWRVSADNGGFSFVNELQDQKIEYRLVVGSFSTDYAANEFARSLKKLGFSGLTTQAVDTGTMIRYRVMSGPYERRVSSVRDEAERMGIPDAWWVRVPGESEPIMATAKPAVPAKPSALARHSAPVEVNITPPAPGEDIMKYCAEKANAREREIYCTNEKLLVPIHREMVMNGARGPVYINFCTEEATAAERHIYCNNAEFQRRQNP